MTPTWQTDDGAIRLFHADCRDVKLEGVNAVISDPPYGMNNDTDSTRFSGGKVFNGRMKQLQRHGEPVPAPFPGGIIGDDAEFDPTPWIDFPQVILWGSNHYAARLPVGATLIWIKKDKHLFGTFLSDAEIAWRKGGCGVYCFHRNWSGFSRLATVGKSSHPNEKPLELMQWCVAMTSGVVADPYMGSCTTGIACIRTGRKFIGIEKEPKYFDIAVKRIEAELNRHPLFEAPPKIQREIA